jgi:hypothetical protein
MHNTLIIGVAARGRERSQARTKQQKRSSQRNFVVKQSARTSANLPSAADTGRKSLSRNFSRVEDALIQAEILCAGLSLLELLHLNPLKIRQK